MLTAVVTCSFRRNCNSQIARNGAFASLAISVSFSKDNSVRRNVTYCSVLLNARDYLPQEACHGHASARTLTRMVINFTFRARVSFQCRGNSRALTNQPIGNSIGAPFSRSNLPMATSRSTQRRYSCKAIHVNRHVLRHGISTFLRFHGENKGRFAIRCIVGLVRLAKCVTGN